MEGGLLRLVSKALAERQLQRIERYNWLKWARPDQIPAGEFGANDPRRNWAVWMKMAGRGNGKTRLGAETVRMQVMSGRRRSIAICAPTLNDARKLMIEGPSGLRSISPPAEKPTFVANKREVYWPNGTIGYVYTSEEPENFRGPEHDLAWVEELGSWKNSKQCWDNLKLTMRRTGPMGDRPQIIVTTTPRPTKVIKELVNDPDVVISRGTTYDNAKNLDPYFLKDLLKYQGTQFAKQELEGKLELDMPGALFHRGQIAADRVWRTPDLIRVVVAIDPAVADAETRKQAENEQDYNAEVGIIVAGVGRCLCKNEEAIHGFVLEDLSGPYGATPDLWAKIAVDAYRRHNADRIVAEVNNGGALVGAVLRAYGGGGSRIPYRPVVASRGKQIRAEPVAALNDKHEIHHVGEFEALEEQLTTWAPLISRKSPDRLDAYVWAMTDLMLGPNAVMSTGSRVPVVHGVRRM